MQRQHIPTKQGLYDPNFEHDACGIGFIANIKGMPSHQNVVDGINMLIRLEHRGGQGKDEKTSDGAGIMTQIPHQYFRTTCDFQIPDAHHYGVGMVFLPNQKQALNKCIEIIETIIPQTGLDLLGWREVPVNEDVLGTEAKRTQPTIYQLFISNNNIDNELEFNRKLYIFRKLVQKSVHEKVDSEHTFYFASLSNRTIVYKGMLTPDQLPEYYLDLQEPSFTSAFAMVHSRFSTNTFPSWERAHPNRYLIHNGEINTLRGNMNWIRTKEKTIKNVWEDSIETISPIIEDSGSDSAAVDNCLEFLHLSGRSLPHAAMMMIPEPWDKSQHINEPVRSFYEYHSKLMEPWDGPTAIAYTNGLQIGALLDRNGLRPGRYYITKDDRIIFSSEAGVVDIKEQNIEKKERLKPGQMLLVDLESQRIIPNEELKLKVATEKPYQSWVKDSIINMNEFPEKLQGNPNSQIEDLTRLQKAFGYTYEELTKNMVPMIADGKDPIGSMGNDTPLAVLSDRPQLLFNYFKQLFAQVTNPPIDAIREEAVTSTMTLLGTEENLLNEDGPEHKQIRLETPIMTTDQLEMMIDWDHSEFRVSKLPILFSKGMVNLELSIEQVLNEVDNKINAGYNIIVLSDKGLSNEKLAIPSLLATSAVHQHLIRTGNRSKVSLIIESGEPRDVHHFAMLLGYGTDAIVPYLAYQTIDKLVSDGSIEGKCYEQAVNTYVQTATNGIVKVLSKMGISTIQSYRGAQIFEAIGISNDVINRYFTGTTSQIGGITLDVIEKETKRRHDLAFSNYESRHNLLESGSELQWRKGGEHHSFNPETIYLLQQSARTNNYEQYKMFSEKMKTEKITYLRDLIELKNSQSIPLEEVEPIESIMKRFKTGAMSFGALSKEAHEALAIAMNRIGGKSNSGEGGEDPNRNKVDENGDLRRSAIKQVASGRFGVDSYYLANADEIQIKMAQGAKPGEGGHLPGKKVYPWIAEVRGSTPGVGLISPPPHHDIYSIEDLAQLIHDLKNANPNAKISVKLVAKSGVGTIAAGVAKGLADTILISGYEGGTGASPRTSIKHAGLPWELGLAETHQTLLLNGLRDRVILETDGKLMTGRDVVIAAILGAEEFGFSTAPLIALGCIMMRACQSDTCPVGIATQNPELRKKFMGDPQHIVNYLTFIAMEVRELLASLGCRSIDDLIGKTDLITTGNNLKSHWKAKHLNLEPLLYQPNVSLQKVKQPQDHKLEKSLDYQEIIPTVKQSLQSGEKMEASFFIKNTNRVTGTLLGNLITEEYGQEGLPEDTIKLKFYGSAGQSFGAFIPSGLTLKLTGDGNDYVGKGLSGGKIILSHTKAMKNKAQQNVIAGNVALYGATAGEAYFNGQAGERFAIRNSGANAVVEGIGRNGCEYMTGGRVVILGEIGENFAAGMSGGIAYILNDYSYDMHSNLNTSMIEIEQLSDHEEVAFVKQFITNHLKYTGSKMASHILNHWIEYVPKFVKVIPTEYKKALTQFERYNRSTHKSIHEKEYEPTISV